MTGPQNTPQIKKQVAALVSEMTLEEKISQMGALWAYELQTQGELDHEKLAARLKHGIGQINRIGGSGNYYPQEAARTYNQIQKYLVEETRLGVPAINHEECCSGLMTPGSSVYPQMIGLASTFQPELATELTQSIRKQMLAVGARQGLAPVLDVGRDPRWGRIEETFGEDPCLVSQFGVAYIKGLQGEGLSQGVMATGKHFVGHSFSAGGLNCGPVHIGPRELWETYLPPFQAAIRDAGLAAMMNAYPELDGELVAASKRIMTELLRDELGFDGLVVSDYEAVMMIHNYHYAASSKQEAAIQAINAGIDIELPTIACYGEPLLEALQSGEISLEIIDGAVSRHLQKKFELDLFDNPYVDEGAVVDVFETPENRALAYKIATQSLVLLKNDGVLPLKKTLKKVAVIGPNADSQRNMMGDYSFAAVLELMHFAPPADSRFLNLSEADLETPSVNVPTFLESLQKRYGEEMDIFYAPGCDLNSDDRSGFDDALAAAEASDVVIAVMGHRSGLAPTCTTGEFRDSTDLGLPGVQEALVEALQATDKPLILVLINGRPASIPELVKGCHAILEAWVPGEEGGNAIVDALFGDVNPGGKLPLSIPRSAGQVPVYYNHKPSGLHSNIYGDYANEPVTPLFPFGHGLSYTDFEYSQLSIVPEQSSADGTVDITLQVTNTGDVSGEEVVQLYTRDEYASVPQPVKALRGFVRLALDPGQTKTVTFHLPVNQLAFYDRVLRLSLEPGKILVMVGTSSEDIRLTGEFELLGDGRMQVAERVLVCPVEVK